MKKFYVLLLGLLFIPLITSAQQYIINKTPLNKYTPYSNKLENIVNKESKTYWAKWMKMIMNEIWIYLKNWDNAYKNWNYNSAIKNYKLAIEKLKNIRWTKEIIKEIERMIKEIETLNNKNQKINPNNVKKINTQIRRR